MPHAIAERLGSMREFLVQLLLNTANDQSRDLSLSGYPRFWRDDLKPYFGYDQWVLWMALPEVLWVYFLDEIGFAPGVANMLPRKLIAEQFKAMKTRDQDKIERQPGVGHDVNAMLQMLRQGVPFEVGKYFHFGWTSYDDIETARALMFYRAHKGRLRIAMNRVDILMRDRIRDFANKIQMHRTHLQYALPGLVGLWLSVLHRHFIDAVRQADQTASVLTGKLTGATGSGAAPHALGIQEAFFRTIGEKSGSMETFFLTQVMGLGKPSLSTQIVDSRMWARYLTDMFFVSSVLGQLGEDARILASSDIGEVVSVSSTSSTMAHKLGNPIAAEGLVGMFRMNLGEVIKPLTNSISDLQRDLCNSRPSRDYQTLVIYLYEQLRTAERLLSNMKCNDDRLAKNFEGSKFLVMGELLYLALVRAGMPDAHTFVNKTVVPEAARQHYTLLAVMDQQLAQRPDLAQYWDAIPQELKTLLLNPEKYLGNAVEICEAEAANTLD